MTDVTNFTKHFMMLKDKVVIITGGAGLIGREFVRAVAENNGIAIIADVDEKIGHNIIESCKNEAYAHNLIFHFLDVTSSFSINELIEDVSNKYGKIDAWVNNAYPKNKNIDKDSKREFADSFFEVNFTDFCESMNLNIGSTFLCSQKIAEFYIKQGYGNIINISSIYGFLAPRFSVYEGTKMTMPVDYAINKSALLQLTRYMAKYLASKNIRVNSISPGGVYNNQPESFVSEYNKLALNQGMLNQGDISGTLLFLISNHSKLINGQNIIVDDGWSL